VQIVRGGRDLAARLRRDPRVRFVEPNYIYRASETPGDPLAGEQWQLGSAVMGLPQAWDQTTGSQDVTVAVVDTGVRLSHPDLAGNLWRDPTSGLHGVNLVSGGEPVDDMGHGTHVAGIIGAEGDNGVGVAGVAWRVRIMPVKVLDGEGNGTASGVAAGIRYAVSHGARIVNVSLNGPGRSQDLEDAIREARAAGVLIVCSAGNDGRSLDSQPSYPASYPEDNVIAVAATSRDGGLASFSNSSASAVALAAPGDEILSTASDGGYEYRSGTSMAAPEVAGVLALMAAARPDLSGSQLRDALLAGTRYEPALAGRVAHGALDAARALREVIDPAAWRIPVRPVALRITPPRRSRGAVRAGTVTLRWQALGDVGAVGSYRVSLNGRRVARLASASASAPPARAVRVRVSAGRRYTVRVVAYDRSGQLRAEATTTFRVARGGAGALR
jgi:subtilisin family serine protease